MYRILFGDLLEMEEKTPQITNPIWQSRLENHLDIKRSWDFQPDDRRVSRLCPKVSVHITGPAWARAKPCHVGADGATVPTVKGWISSRGTVETATKWAVTMQLDAGCWSEAWEGWCGVVDLDECWWRLMIDDCWWSLANVDELEKTERY